MSALATDQLSPEQFVDAVAERFAQNRHDPDYGLTSKEAFELVETARHWANASYRGDVPRRLATQIHELEASYVDLFPAETLG